MHTRRLTHRAAVAWLALSVAAWPLVSAAQPAASAARVATPLAGTSTSPEWNKLTATQKRALAPLERDWGTIDAARRAKWLEISARYATMPAEEQRRIHERMTEWARLTPAERSRARLSYQEAKRVPAPTRQASWEAYQALPDTERKALAARATPSSGRPSNPAISVVTPGAQQRQLPSMAKPVSPAAQTLAPAIVQGKPGATTTAINRVPNPPLHQQPGQPKIEGKPSQVDRATLLPRKAASTGGTPASSPAR